MPDAWQKLLTKSAITREDYAKDPQAVLDVLEFYTDHQKREMEEMGVYPGASTTSPSTLSPFATPASSAPRFNAGTGLGGANMSKITPADPRPVIRRQDSAPAGMNGEPDPRGGNSNNLSQNAALARAAELVNGSHAQHASTIAAHQGSGTRPSIPQISSGGSGSSTPQSSRPAPPRPLLTANRPAPPTPGSQKSNLSEHQPTSSDLGGRVKAQGPRSDHTKPPGLVSEIPPQRKESLKEEKRPYIAPSKSSPATTQPATSPVSGAAGATAGPPPVKPLQPIKKGTPFLTITEPEDDGASGSIAAAAAALEKTDKPKDKEKRISTMTEAQIMEKLRTVVNPDDPKLLYSKIRKVGQG